MDPPWIKSDIFSLSLQCVSLLPVQAVLAEGPPSLPLVGGGEVYAEQDARLADAHARDLAGQGLESQESVLDAARKE